MLKAKATLKYYGNIPAYMVIVDLGIAPGFTVDPGDFADWQPEASEPVWFGGHFVIALFSPSPGNEKPFETQFATFFLQGDLSKGKLQPYFVWRCA